MVKIFMLEKCERCSGIKDLHEQLNQLGIQVELFDMGTPEGLAEARWYNIDESPSVLWENEDGDMVGYRGVLPNINELKEILGEQLTKIR